MMKKLIKRILKRQTNWTEGAPKIANNRVTLEGIKKAIVRAQDLDAEKFIIVLVDRDHDANGRRFVDTLEYEMCQISGEPTKDLKHLDAHKTSFVIGFDSDEQASRYLEYIYHQGGKYFCSFDIKNARWWNIRDSARDVLEFERKDCDLHNYSHFAPDQLANIMQAIDITKEISGHYVEIGVFKGTSARSAFHYMRKIGLQRNCYFLDTFGGFDYEQAKTSADAHWQGTHDANMEDVRKRLDATPDYDQIGPEYTLSRNNITEDALPESIDKIALCNIDVDIYEAVLAALEKVWPFLENRGIAIVQDPGRTPLLGGARLALDLFLASKSSRGAIPVYLESGQTFLIKSV
jgi:hypothetical protein